MARTNEWMGRIWVKDFVRRKEHGKIAGVEARVLQITIVVREELGQRGMIDNCYHPQKKKRRKLLKIVRGIFLGEPEERYRRRVQDIKIPKSSSPCLKTSALLGSITPVFKSYVA